MIPKVFIGYRTQPSGDLLAAAPEFKAPSNYVDKEKINAAIQVKREQFAAEAAHLPYTASLSEIYIFDAGSSQATQFVTVPEKKSPASRALRYLLKAYPQAWGDEAGYEFGKPTVIFVGFKIRMFLKILGIECSLPGSPKRAPLGLWTSGSNYRDIGDLICPPDYGFSFPYVLSRRRPVDPVEGQTWDTLVDGWTGPGVSPEQDALLAVELATQVGMLRE
jgi:hypothetical protein